MSFSFELEEIEQAIIGANGYCLKCYYPYAHGSVRSYDHEGGITIVGMEKKQWVYLTCRCSFDYSLRHVLARIKRDEGQASLGTRSEVLPTYCQGGCSYKLAAPESFPAGSYCSMYCCGCCPDRRVSPCQRDKRDGGIIKSLIGSY